MRDGYSWLALVVGVDSWLAVMDNSGLAVPAMVGVVNGLAVAGGLWLGWIVGWL